jgi:hypothetical protein
LKTVKTLVKQLDKSDWLITLGILFLCVGGWLINPALAFFIAGAACITLAILVEVANHGPVEKADKEIGTEG